MNETNVCNTKLDNPLQVSLGRSKSWKKYLLMQSMRGKGWTRHSIILSQHWTMLTLLVLSSVSSGVSVYLFSTNIDKHVGVASASISLRFLGGENIFEK